MGRKAEVDVARVQPQQGAPTSREGIQVLVFIVIIAAAAAITPAAGRGRSRNGRTVQQILQYSADYSTVMSDSTRVGTVVLTVDTNSFYSIVVPPVLTVRISLYLHIADRTEQIAKVT